MQSISLRRVLPSVFSHEPECHASSGVWLNDELRFEKGKHYLVEAASGTGKSSLCSFIYGIRRDYQGDICFDGENIREFPIGRWCQLRKRSLAFLPQEMALFPELTALENIELKNSLTGHFSRKDIMAMLDEMEIGSKASAPVARLSIGQQQRVAIIRALCQPFDFLLLDEPVSHLDSRSNGIASGIVLREAMRQGAGIITTSVGNPLSLKSDVATIYL